MPKQQNEIQTLEVVPADQSNESMAPPIECSNQPSDYETELSILKKQLDFYVQEEMQLLSKMDHNEPSIHDSVEQLAKSHQQ